MDGLSFIVVRTVRLPNSVGHEGPGNILSYIENKGWAYGLSADADPVCPGTPGRFVVKIQLSDEGLERYPEIAKVFFQYLSLLLDSSYLQESISRQSLLGSPSTLHTFASDEINEALSMLRPDRLRLCAVSRRHSGDWDRKEKWYGTEYKYGKLPATLMAELDAALATPSNQCIPELSLPHKNNFFPGELKAENKDTAGPALLPCLLRDDGRAKVWWKKHPSQIPRTNVKISLKSPVIDASAESAVKARFFADLVRDALRGYVYDAKLAALEYCLSPNSRGFILDTRGYNDKLLEFLQQVCSTMKDLSIQSDRFDVSY